MAEFIQIRYGGGRCYDVKGTWTEYCLPVLKICYETETDGYLVECDKEYNLIRCPEEDCYAIPFVAGDKIQFQTQFFDRRNDDPEAPTQGWGEFVHAILTDEATGEVVSTDFSEFASRFFVCHNGKFSYQTIEIDTSTEIIPDCFSIKFYAVDAEDEVTDERCTHQYALEPTDCPEPTVLLEGVHSEIDCLNYYYGQPGAICEEVGQPGATVFKYNPTIRIRSSLLPRVSDIDDNDGANIAIQKYELWALEFMPNQLINYLHKTFFSNKYIIIDGIKHELVNFAIEVQYDLENSAWVNYQWTKVCSRC